MRAVVDGQTIFNVYDAGGALVHVAARDNANTAANEEKLTTYVSGPMGALARISTVSNTDTITYLHSDHLGSAQAGTDASGALKWREQYTPFGEEIQRVAANDNLGGFTGHIKDKATGLNYMQARYYDPVIGRFLSIDPVGFLDTGAPEQFNRYAYAWNDPINSTDPDGRCSTGCVYKYMDAHKRHSGPNGSGKGVDGVLAEVNSGQGTGLAITAALLSPVDETTVVLGVLGKIGGKIVGAAKGLLGGKKGTIDVGNPPITIGNTPSTARADLDSAGFPGTASPGNQTGTVHSNVPGTDGPMDVRIMDGAPGSSSGDLNGPRAVTTLPGQPRAGVTPDGTRLQNPTRQEMRSACHTPLQCD